MTKYGNFGHFRGLLGKYTDRVSRYKMNVTFVILLRELHLLGLNTYNSTISNVLVINFKYLLHISLPFSSNNNNFIHDKYAIFTLSSYIKQIIDTMSISAALKNK